MRLFAICVLLLTGCEGDPNKALRLLSGNNEQTIVLAAKPFTIDSVGRTFHSSEKIKVQGETSSTCLVLKSNYPLKPQPQMDKTG